MMYQPTKLLMVQKKPYREVEYLESTGVQYINTGIALRDVYGFDIEFQSTGIVQSTSNKLDGILGVNGIRNNGVLTDTKLWFSYSDENAVYNSAYMRGAVVTSPQTRVPAAEYYAAKHRIYIKDKVFNWDGEQVEFAGEYADVVSTVPIYLFSVCTGSTAGFYSKTKIYSFKLYDENNKLLCDMKPCIRLSDNKPAMYDVVSKQFFTNSGTGEFIVGE